MQLLIRCRSTSSQLNTWGKKAQYVALQESRTKPFNQQGYMYFEQSIFVILNIKLNVDFGILMKG